MPTILLRNVDVVLLERLTRIAHTARRSRPQQILVLLEEAVDRIDRPATPARRRRARQTAAPSLDGFDAWYQAYPRKVAKRAAEKAWATLAPDAALQARMVAAVAAQRDCPQWQRGQDYIPHPATWLHQRRWEDDVAPTDTAALHDWMAS